MNLIRSLMVASAAFLFAGSASAQNAGTVTAHAYAIGQGAGHSGYTSLLCGSAQLAVGQDSADPICQTITGDVTIDADGVTAVGSTKVTSAMLNADVFSTAHTWAGQQTFVAPVLGTPASGTLTNATGLPISTGVSGLGSGVATWLATASSANLRSALTDETGTGLAYFQGGNLGTPSAGVLTNGTGLPVSTGISGLGTGIASWLATPSSANLATAVTNETGSGALVFGTSPVITTPTGIVKGDVGLGNVDNTSDATKWAATATLTNKNLSDATNTFPTFNQNTTGSAAKLTTARNIDGQAFDGTAAITVIAPGTHAATGKTTPVDADELPIVDSAASNVLKKLTWANLKATLRTAFDLVYAPLASPALTGTPTAPTASPGTNTTQISTTAFVTAAVAASTAGVSQYNGRTGAVTALGTDVPIRSYLAGLTLSTAGSSATFGIAAGVATDSTNADMMSLASAMTKTTSSWAVGSGNGALDTGTIANGTWYHAFLIKRPDTGVVDVLISTSATSPTMPTGYTLARRIGSMLTDGSAHWVKFVQDGDDFAWNAMVRDVASTNPGTLATTRVLSTPLGVRVKAVIAVSLNAGSSGDSAGGVIISDFSISDQIPTSTGAFTNVAFSGAGSSSIGSMGQVYTTTSSAVRSRLSNSGPSTILTINTLGWIDRRGRDD